MQIHSPNDLAHAVRDYVYSKRDLSPLPWNRHEPVSTLWWLTPSPTQPCICGWNFVFSTGKRRSPKAPDWPE